MLAKSSAFIHRDGWQPLIELVGAPYIIWALKLCENEHGEGRDIVSTDTHKQN
jgi:hypothetical protein